MTENEARGLCYVVLPAYLALKIVPVESRDTYTTATTSNWYLISGHDYILDVEVYDRESHKLSNIDVCGA